jgi:uncharacterized Zn finger protein
MAKRQSPRTDEPTGAEVQDRFRPLTETDLREMTDSGSFDRGRSYARGDRIFDASLRGAILQASCHGSSGGPYRVEATLVPLDDAKTKRPLADYLCTCPRGGFCKHVVALLLTWIQQPEAFAVRPTVGELLTGRGRDELAALVELMVRREPDLVDLIELAPPAPVATDVPGTAHSAEPGAANKRTVSPAAIRRQVAKAFAALEERTYGGWYESPDVFAIQQQLASLLAIGEGYAAAGRWADAAVVFGTMLEEAAESWEGAGDEEGDLLIELGRAAAGLAGCLKAQADLPPDARLADDDRAEIVERLFTYWELASDYDTGDDEAEDAELLDPAAAITAYATEAERASIEDRLRSRIDAPTAADEWSAGHEKLSAIWFLSLLRGGMSDDELVAEYRAAELWPEAAALLVEQGRIDEAVGLAGRKLAQPMQLTAFADSLVARGGADADRAIELVEGRLWEQEGTNVHSDLALLTWLGATQAKLGRADRALTAEQRRFAIRPGVDTYRAVRAAATLPGQPADLWSGLRPELVKTFRGKEDWSALVQIHLEDGETAEAIAALQRLEKGRARPAGGFSGWGWSADYGLGDLRQRVAKAAERSHPDEAIRLYTLLAEQQIEGRQRPYYHEAAALLARARAVYETQGRAEKWTAYIGDLRETNKRLRALREELDALGLR